MTTGSPDYGKCVTCGNVFHYNDLQAGHFLPGRYNAILFDERGVHAQCRGCNIFGGGQQAKYRAFMERVYGFDVIEELQVLTRAYKKFTIEEHREETDRLNRWAQIIEDNEVVPREAAGPYLRMLRAAVGGKAE